MIDCIIGREYELEKLYSSNKFEVLVLLRRDDIYTENVNIAEDIIQTIFDLGAKSVTL